MSGESARKAREWSPRFWEGADFFAWIRLLAKNHFAVEPPYWYIAAIVTGMSLSNTFLRWLQQGRYSDQIDRVELPQPPLLVLGHWRTGTTLLHELLMLDDRHAAPTTHDCFMPCHPLLTGDFYRRHLNFLLPAKRPMDAMPAGWDRPQEDEFALVLLGHPSPYADFAFPNRPPLFPGSLDLSGLTPRELRSWKRELLRFVKTIAVRDRRRLVLKSPPHTARIPVLLELFPDARFVHLTRDPYTLFASTMNLWLSMSKKHGFQKPRGGPELEERVFRDFRLIHDRYEAGKKLIPPGHLVEMRYEDLVADLEGGVRRVYEGLALGGFEAVRPRLEEYAANSRGYATNKYEITSEVRAKIRQRWGDIIDRLGY
jgi:hypothetical protein